MFKDIVRVMKGGMSFLHYDLTQNIKRWLNSLKQKTPSWYTQSIVYAMGPTTGSDIQEQIDQIF